jgi:hypothetical protein
MGTAQSWRCRAAGQAELLFGWDPVGRHGSLSSGEGDKPGAHGRAHGPFPLPKREPYPIPLEQCIAPSGQTSWQSWRDQYRGMPVRLEITCIRDDLEPFDAVAAGG